MGGGKSGTGNQGGSGSAGSRGTTASTNPGLRFAGSGGIHGFASGASESALHKAVDGGNFVSEKGYKGTNYTLGVEVANANGNKSYSYYDTASIYVPDNGGPITLDYTTASGAVATSKYKTLEGAKKAGKKRLKSSISAHYNSWKNTGSY